MFVLSKIIVDFFPGLVLFESVQRLLWIFELYLVDLIRIVVEVALNILLLLRNQTTPLLLLLLHPLVFPLFKHIQVHVQTLTVFHRVKTFLRKTLVFILVHDLHVFLRQIVFRLNVDWRQILSFVGTYFLRVFSFVSRTQR